MSVGKNLTTTSEATRRTTTVRPSPVVKHLPPNALGRAVLAYLVVFFLEHALHVSVPSKPAASSDACPQSEPAGAADNDPGNQDHAIFAATKELNSMAAEMQGWAWATGDMTELAMCTMPPGGTLVLRQQLRGTLARSKRQLGLGLLLLITSDMGAMVSGRTSGCYCQMPWVVNGHSDSPS